MTDKYGNPYTDHLERVADRVREMEYDFVDETSEIELYIATAYLHDILEDTSCDQQEIFMEFGSDVVGAVRRLTRGRRHDLCRIHRGNYATRIYTHPARENSKGGKVGGFVGPRFGPDSMSVGFEKEIREITISVNLKGLRIKESYHV